MQGRAAIISGAGIIGDPAALAPIGFAIAERLARAGGSVMILDRDSGAAEAAVERIRADGGRAAAVVGDVSTIADCKRAVEAALATFGGLDILVNNAAVTSRTPAHEMTGQEWRRVIDVNLTGAMFLTHAALSPMMKQGRGVILNVASAAGMRSFGSPAYAASKAGLIGLTVELAGSHGVHGIRANAIVPGTVETPMAHRFRARPTDVKPVRGPTALPEPGYAADVAEAALFLCGDGARWITGTTLPVDGGMLVLPPLLPAAS